MSCSLGHPIRRVLLATLAAGCSSGGHGSPTPVPPPTAPVHVALTGVYPRSGPLAGGTTVNLSGSGFQAGATVTFGGTAATSVVVVSAGTITCATPAGSAGTVGVVVDNLTGPDPSLAGAFTYQANSPPVISTSLSPLAEAFVGDEVTFTVTASDPDADFVALTLLNPPAGCIAQPIPSLVSPQTMAVRWLVGPASTGLNHLYFEARDNQTPANVDVRCFAICVLSPPGHALVVRNAVLSGDLSGDNRPDLLAIASRYDSPSGTYGDEGELWIWSSTMTGSKRCVGLANQPGFMLGGAPTAAIQAVQLADVTGDGVLDTVALTAAAGEIYVWAGGASGWGGTAPAATATLQAGTFVSGPPSALVLRDVTGDGTVDVVATLAVTTGPGSVVGKVAVWAGGATLVGIRTPTATLIATGSVETLAADLRCADVTGDGILDVLAVSPTDDVGPVSDAGAIYLWKGGAALAGTVAASARLAVTSPVANDHLGQATVLADVTGDGTADIVAGTPDADIGTATDAGAIHLWAGGSALSGSPAPANTLTIPSTVAGDALGALRSGSVRVQGGCFCADVTGDGTLDIVAGATSANTGAVVDSGGVFVWAGGTGLLTANAPTATLAIPSAAAGDRLGFASGRGIQAIHVVGSATLDLVVGARDADVGGTADAGAIFVWAGGSGLSGTPAPTATLSVTGAAANDRLGHLPSFGTYGPWAIQCADVTGDFAPDVVAITSDADAGVLLNTGAIHVWAGGSGLSGAVAPTASLTVSGAVQGDALGAAEGQGLQLADVTGDGTLDVLAAAPSADAGSTLDAGAIYVWAGGSGLSGSVSTPTATLRITNAQQNDRLGNSPGETGFGLAPGGGAGWLCLDITGDGTLDVIGSAIEANTSIYTDSGGLYYWAGGAALTGTVTRTPLVSGGYSSDRLGDAGGTGLFAFDYDGDGAVDIGVAGYQATLWDYGVVQIVQGGPNLPSLPTTLLALVGQTAGDRLGS